MAFVFAGLAKATPSMLAEIAIPLAGIIILGVSGMALVSMLIGNDWVIQRKCHLQSP